MLLERLLANKKIGFYVDVGAHHPKRFSNTYYFHMRGWRGINIDPNPVAYDLFMKMRSQDINLQLGIADHTGELLYFEFEDPALNTFDESLMHERERNTPYKCIGTQCVRVEPLAKVLEKHLVCGQEIDFLTVDVEGLDLKVLRSNDWIKFRPKYVLVESLATCLDDVCKGELYKFMTSQGYGFFARTVNTMFFLDNTDKSNVV